MVHEPYQNGLGNEVQVLSLDGTDDGVLDKVGHSGIEKSHNPPSGNYIYIEVLPGKSTTSLESSRTSVARELQSTTVKEWTSVGVSGPMGSEASASVADGGSAIRRNDESTVSTGPWSIPSLFGKQAKLTQKAVVKIKRLTEAELEIETGEKASVCANLRGNPTSTEEPACKRRRKSSFPCSICGHVFETYSERHVHYLQGCMGPSWAKVKRTFTCGRCTRSFGSVEARHWHFLEGCELIRQIKTFSCNLCSQVMETSGERHRHYLLHLRTTARYGQEISGNAEGPIMLDED